MAGREKLEKGFLRDEILDHATYTMLAKKERNRELRALFETLASKEDGHIRTWRRLLDGKGDDIGEPPFVGVRVWLLLFLGRALGVAFVARLLELDEQAGLRRYEEGLRSGAMEERDKVELRRIIKEERVHEADFAGKVMKHQGDLGYTQSIILGLNDGLVEILAVVAGLATVASTSFIVVIIGLIAGISGTLSMAGGVYLASKSQNLVSERREGQQKVSPAKEGYYTGVYYFLGALLAVLPFIFGLKGAPGIVASLILVSLALIVASAIIAIISGTSIARRSFEMVAVSLGAAFCTILFGAFAKIYFGVSI